MRVITDHEFDAAHHLPCHDGACARLHGHRYRFEVQVEGGVDSATGMVLDFERLDRLVQQEVLTQLDHRDLNEVLDNPTAEQLADWIWRRLHAHLPGLCAIRIWETPRYSVLYEGPVKG